MLMSITFIFKQGEKKKRDKTKPKQKCLLSHIFVAKFQKILDGNKGFLQPWWSQLSSHWDHSCGQKQAHPMQLASEHGRRKRADIETNSMLDSLPFEMFHSTLIIFSKNLLRLERARAWYWHYLVDSSARCKFINSDKFFLSLKCLHLQFLSIWKIVQWHFSNLLCANCISEIHSNPQGHPWLVHAPSENKSHPLMASVLAPTTTRLGGRAGTQNHLILCKTLPFVKSNAMCKWCQAFSWAQVSLEMSCVN